MQERFPRIRRIALAIKSEDFSRRVTPLPTPDASGRMPGSEAPDLSAMLAAEAAAIIRLKEATD